MTSSRSFSNTQVHTLARDAIMERRSASSIESSVYSTEHSVYAIDEAVQQHLLQPKLRASDTSTAPVYYMYRGCFPYLEHFARQAQFDFHRPDQIAAVYVMCRTHPDNWFDLCKESIELKLQCVARVNTFTRNAGTPSPLELTEISGLFQTFLRPAQQDVDEHSEQTQAFIRRAMPLAAVSMLNKANSTVNARYRAAMTCYTCSNLAAPCLESLVNSAHLYKKSEEAQQLLAWTNDTRPDAETMKVVVRSFVPPLVRK